MANVNPWTSQCSRTTGGYCRQGVHNSPELCRPLVFFGFDLTVEIWYDVRVVMVDLRRFGDEKD